MKRHQVLLPIGIYLAALVVTLFVVEQLAFNNLFSQEHFLNWDAQHYQSIKDHGYDGFRVAFFPLFPLLWRSLSISPIGMALVNGIIFLVSFLYLLKEFQIRNKAEIVLYLTIPSFLFFFLPYSESLFFASSVLLLTGFKKNKDVLIYAGLFLAILTRPAFAIFIPALIITELLDFDKKSLKKIILSFLIALAGITIVSIIQYLDTGKYFQFFSAQKSWGNSLQIPILPFTSWAGGFIVKLDGMALLFGVIAGLILILRMINPDKVKKIIFPREVIFSLAYLSGISLSVILFRGGSLFSLNRFVFATPFIIIVLHYWFEYTASLPYRKLLIIFTIIFAFWLLFASYVHIQQVIKFALLSLYAVLIFAIKVEKPAMRNFFLFCLILINFSFQIILFVRFLSGLWVG